MPLINAHGEIFREWESQLSAYEAHSPLLPNSGELAGELRSLLAQGRQLKAQQEEYEGRRQWATQQLKELVDRGREVVRRMRGYAKSQLGTKSELLVHFGAAPIRRRTRSKKTEPETPAPSQPEQQ